MKITFIAYTNIYIKEPTILTISCTTYSPVEQEQQANEEGHRGGHPGVRTGRNVRPNATAIARSVSRTSVSRYYCLL